MASERSVKLPQHSVERDGTTGRDTNELTSFFGELTPSTLDGQHGNGTTIQPTATQSPQPGHEKTGGLTLPSLRPDIRNWLETVGLKKDEEYVIDPNVGSVCLGLGWDKGADVDASAALFDSRHQPLDLVWFRKLRSSCGSVLHSGDNRTGEGSGDDEQIRVKMDSIPPAVHYILFTVSVFSNDFSFSDLRSAYVRMMHGKPKHRQHVMCQFSLTKMSGHSMLMGLMTRKGGYWSFKALGTPAAERTIVQLVKHQDNLACLSQNPSVLPIYRRIVVTVLGGKNLAPKDKAGLLSRTPTSDPYYVISFKHKTYSSEYKKKTLNPVWKERAFDLQTVTETDRKDVKINVYDYDMLSSNDFMGHIRIAAKGLFNLGPGEHDLYFDLEHSKEKRYMHEDVSGQLHIHASVIQIQQVDTLTKIRV